MSARTTNLKALVCGLAIGGVIACLGCCACANMRQPPVSAPAAIVSPTPQPRRFLNMPMGRGIGGRF
ncbi:MAG: hypothetical protein ACREQE_02745 [Candidatus Binataceae bacterium]